MSNSNPVPILLLSMSLALIVDIIRNEDECTIARAFVAIRKYFVSLSWGRWIPMRLRGLPFLRREHLRSQDFLSMLYIILSSDGRISQEEAQFLDETMDRYLSHYSTANQINVLEAMRRARASGRPFASFGESFVRETVGDTVLPLM